jgi:hypothetical protein
MVYHSWFRAEGSEFRSVQAAEKEPSGIDHDPLVRLVVLHVAMFGRAGEWSCACLVVALLSTLPACKRKDPEKCENAQKVTRQAAEVGDFTLARQWREYAYKHCADTSRLGALDQEITDKERQKAEQVAATERKQAEIEQLLQIFADWTKQNKDAAERAAPGPSCDGPEDKKERWCSAQRSVSGKYTLAVRYWEAEPAAAQFSVRAPGEVACDKLGPSTVLKTMHGGARVYCDVTGGALEGLKLLVTRTAEGSLVSAFTPKYLERDAGLRAIVEG